MGRGQSTFIGEAGRASYRAPPAKRADEGTVAHTLRTPVSIVIPTRGGRNTLPMVLDALAVQERTGPMNVVVAANGVVDDTTRHVVDAWRGRFERIGNRLEIHQRGDRGRAGAINAASAHIAVGEPIVVLDDDAVLSRDAIASMTRALSTPEVHFCAPTIAFRPSPSMLVNRYSRVWAALPYVRQEVATAGVYAISAVGRQRCGALQRLHSDDKYVRLHFRCEERRLVAEASYTVSLPRSFRELVVARMRYDAGNRELKELGSAVPIADGERFMSSLSFAFRSPEHWTDTIVFATVHVLAALLLTARALRRGLRVHGHRRR